MQIVIDIPEDVYTRLFDNGIQDNEIATDDICEMARALRLGTPLEKHDEEVIKETVESIWGKPPYTELLDKIRTEIEQEYNRLGATRADETLELGECLGLKMSLKIIDKYRKE